MVNDGSDVKLQSVGLVPGSWLQLGPPWLNILIQGSASFVYHFCYICLVFVCQNVVSVHCSLVVTSWKRTDLLALFMCVFIPFPYRVLGKV